jgi:biotin carboxylase
VRRGVSHTEFIRGSGGAGESGGAGGFVFLETSARVGGAFIVDTIEAATGINLWREWAKVEIAGEHGTYTVPPHRQEYAGIVLTLARQETPDMSSYTDPEIALAIRKDYHAGLIVAAPEPQRVET